MSDYASIVVANLATDGDRIDVSLIRAWLKQHNTPEANLKAILQKLITLSDTRVATSVAEQLQFAINGTILEVDFPDLVAMLHHDSTFSCQSAATDGAVLVHAPEDVVLVQVPRVEKAVISYAEDDDGFVTVEWFERGETKGKEVNYFFHFLFSVVVNPVHIYFSCQL